MILLCVIIISLGSDSSKQESTTKDNEHYLYMAIFAAVLSGLCISVNSLDLYVVLEKLKYPVYQLNVDGNILLGLILLPFYLTQQKQSEDPGLNQKAFSMNDIWMANIAYILVLLSTVALSFALLNGKAGTVLAIMNCKIIVQTILATVI